MLRSDRAGNFVLALVLAAALLLAPGAGQAQIYPPAPQMGAADNVDGTDFIRVPSGASGYVDPNKQFCRLVTNDNPNEDVIPYLTAQEWQDYRAGIKNGLAPPGITEVVCCRNPAPQAVTLCQIAGAVPQSFAFPDYKTYGDRISYSANCVDRWGVSYTDTEIWQCGYNQGAVVNGHTVADVTDLYADGQWVKQGNDSYSCSLYAFTTGCSVSCGGGTSETYDSCGNLQSVNSCNTQSCCVSDGSCSGSCGGGTGTDNCGNFCVNNTRCCVPNGSCSGSCGGGSGTDNCGDSCTNNNACTCTPHSYCCGDGNCYTDCGDGTQCAATGQGGCTGGNCSGGSSWDNQGSGCAPGNTCYCGAWDGPPGAQSWVRAGPGCCSSPSTGSCY